jgi:hypothetical protein
MSRNEGRFGAADVAPEDEGSSAVPASTQSEGFSWTVPTEFVELPSKGRFYPPQHPLSGKETIEIRYMTAKEEDILSDRALLKKGVAIDRALQNLVVDKGIRVDELLVGDKNALVVAARVTGYGSEYNTTVVCPSCIEKIDYSFDLADVGTIDIEQAMEESGVELTEKNTFMVKLPMTKVSVECKMLTGADEVRLAKNTIRSSKKNEASSALTDQLKATIVSLNGDTDRVNIISFAHQMPARDARYLRNTLASVVPNVDLTQDFECTECGHSADLEVPLTSDFFWPR